ncbi:MAG TPA: hypothetical protein VGU71_04145 [Candidatus Dormibacteraeota bacterium]|nr:hypothetical protein [Candidatus Dormibacteraeota bacterium]
MVHDISGRACPAPPDAPDAPKRLAALYSVDLDFLRARMDALELDVERLASWAGLSLKETKLVFATGVATRKQIRFLRRGLRWRTVDLHGLDEDAWAALTMRSLAPDVRS